MITIVLEGENKCGKSTLANKLRDEYGFKIVKCSQPQPGEDVFQTYLAMLEDIKPDDRIVFDRFYYGENVYGKIYRKKSQLTKTMCRDIESKLLSLNTLVIYCHDEVRNIKRRFKQEGEDFASSDKIRRTLDLFEAEMAKTKLPWIRHKILGKRTDLTRKGRLRKIVSTLHANETTV